MRHSPGAGGLHERSRREARPVTSGFKPGTTVSQTAAMNLDVTAQPIYCVTSRQGILECSTHF